MNKNPKRKVSENASYNPESKEITHTKKYEDGTTETTKINFPPPNNPNDWLKGGGVSATSSSKSNKRKKSNDVESK